MALSTDDLRDAALARLGDDSTFKSLTGADALDPRLYYRFKSEAEVTDLKPAYVVYLVLPHGETVDGVTKPVLSLTVWTVDEHFDTMVAVRDRIFELFDK